MNISSISTIKQEDLITTVPDLIKKVLIKISYYYYSNQFCLV